MAPKTCRKTNGYPQINQSCPPLHKYTTHLFPVPGIWAHILNHYSIKTPTVSLGSLFWTQYYSGILQLACGCKNCCCGYNMKKFWKNLRKNIDYWGFICYDICLIKLLEVSASLLLRPGYAVVPCGVAWDGQTAESGPAFPVFAYVKRRKQTVLRHICRVSCNGIFVIGPRLRRTVGGAWPEKTLRAAELCLRDL